MQLAGPNHLVQLPLQADDLIVDRPTVALDLGFPRAADKAETAALPFQVGPGADQTGPLIAQRRKLDLQHTFAGPGTVGEDLKDQRGAVQKLDAPSLLQIALLHR
ncbi:MAG: Uncharacterized protein FD150_1659 [Rhodobacteraceae bacterium]|nr:MAG: Uncharacterized protein FD150_1659 [Paracoccaceae bacterium]